MASDTASSINTRRGSRPRRSALGALLRVFVGVLSLGAGAVLPGAHASASLNWSIVSSPNGSGVGSELAGVSCPSATFCVAVGESDGTLIESWNGSAWSPVLSLSLSSGSQLDGVACTSPAFCVAVGFDGPNQDTIIESWDGSAWSLGSNPNNVPALGELHDVSCTSISSCVAVGCSGCNCFQCTSDTLVESWNGIAWSVVSSPNGSQSVFNNLAGVSCSSPDFCVAVGATGSNMLLESWNGSAWSIVASPSPGVGASLNGVSCTSASFCIVVGGDGHTGDTLIESWNGSAWTIDSSPNPSSVFNALTGVSCTSPSFCAAVGDYADNTGNTETLAESWDGSAWSADSSANPASPMNEFIGVSCTVQICAAAGFFFTGSVDNTLVEMATPKTPPPPTLSITKSHSAGSFAQGGSGAYTITVGDNAGANPTAGAVRVFDTVPAGMTISSMSGTGWTCTPPACTRSDSIAGGGSYAPITVDVHVASNAPTTGQLVNHASVSGGGDPSGPHTAADPTTITGGTPPSQAASLSITKSHGNSFGQNTSGSYTIVVSNAAGVGATSGSVSVVDDAPAGVAITSMVGTGWVCAVPPSCTRSDALQPGDAYPAIIANVKVAANAPTGTVTNHATVSGGGDPATHTAADPTSITGSAPPPQAASLSIAKTHTGSFTPGQSGNYTIAVSNAPEAGSTSGTVMVTENPPSGLTVTNMSGTGWTCIVPICHRSDALPGGSSYQPIAVTVNVSAGLTGTLTNHASVTGGGDPSGAHTVSDATAIGQPTP